jgi:hypothetical protein
MKKIVLILLSTFFMFSFASAGNYEFCAGFKQGYVSGYKQAKNTSMTPMVPMCPMQPMKGFGDPQSDMEHGYTIGYRKGISAY